MMTMVISGSDGVTFPDSTTQNTTDRYGFVNRIINGDMRIDQRNAGAAVTNVTSAYVLDRWAAAGSTDGAVTIQRSSTAPDGFSNSMQLTAATADASIGAAQYYQFFQAIEGFNIADLGLGTANAKTFTVSFWVRSSKTGTYCATLANSGSNRLCPVNFTINSADTWEYKSFSVTGDTSGTWNTTNGVGLYLLINLALGSNYNAGTSGTWNTTQYGTSSQVNWLDTLNATFYITGVQLEVGSVATPFERRDYGRELMMCQRYYELWRGTSSYSPAGTGLASATSSVTLPFIYKVSKRTTSPSLETSSASALSPSNGSGNVTVSNAIVISGASQVNDQSMMISIGVATTPFTLGQASLVYLTNATTNWIAISAEL
jgi:hypothetical protein